MPWPTETTYQGPLVKTRGPATVHVEPGDFERSGYDVRGVNKVNFHAYPPCSSILEGGVSTL